MIQVNEQVMITLCSIVGCGISILVLNLLYGIAKKVFGKNRSDNKKIFPQYTLDEEKSGDSEKDGQPESGDVEGTPKVLVGNRTSF